jgi:hypothetical protein
MILEEVGTDTVSSAIAVAAFSAGDRVRTPVDLSSVLAKGTCVRITGRASKITLPDTSFPLVSQHVNAVMSSELP